MKLKEKMYFDCTLNTDEQAEKNKQIADDYAVEFAEWLVTFGNIRTKYGTWLIMMDLHNPLTTKEALELFKKEKGW